jgi:hypothetical protein
MIEKPYMSKVILAVSANATADALAISRRVVASAILNGALPVHCIGTKHRILTSDIEAWVRSWPAPKSKRKRKIPHGSE